MPSTKDDKSSGDGAPIDRFKQLVTEGSLYVDCRFTNTDLTGIVTVIGIAGLRIDLHCPYCNQPSTFVLPPVTADRFENVHEPHLMLAAQLGAATPRPISQIAQLIHLGRWLELSCARIQSHKVIFVLRIEQKNIVQAARGFNEEVSFYSCIKVGQYPPHAELVAVQLKVVSKIADSLDMKELRRAAGLISHDAAIGAFVYLRRVFERIIAKAWKNAKESGESLPDPPPLRMEEKIEALRNHLPDIVVRNAKVYGILSLGLHELTEEQCTRAYPLVEESVIAMLEDAHMHAEKRKREKRISDELARMSGELGKSS